MEGFYFLRFLRLLRSASGLLLPSSPGFLRLGHMTLAASALFPLGIVLVFAVADAVGEQLTPAQRLLVDHLKATHEAVQRFALERVALPDIGALEDFRAVIHVQVQDSDH